MASTEPEAIEYDITHGESRERLLIQLFDIGRTDRQHHRPTLKLSVYRRGAEIIEDAGRMKFHGDIYVCINGIEAEDGSGDCWMIRGYLSDYEDTLEFESDAMNRFHGFYNTKTRKGWLKPL